MNKTELIAAVAEKTGMSKKDTEAVISATLGTITAALHEEVTVASGKPSAMAFKWMSPCPPLFRITTKAFP